MININNNFNEEILDSKGLAVIDCWAPWCGPCKMFGPVFEEVSNELKNIKFYKLNTEENNEDILNDLGIMSIPTIILFKDGKELKRTMGFMDKDSLIEFLGDI